MLLQGEHILVDGITDGHMSADNKSAVSVHTEADAVAHKGSFQVFSLFSLGEFQAHKNEQRLPLVAVHSMAQTGVNVLFYTHTNTQTQPNTSTFVRT